MLVVEQCCHTRARRYRVTATTHPSIHPSTTQPTCNDTQCLPRVLQLCLSTHMPICLQTVPTLSTVEAQPWLIVLFDAPRYRLAYANPPASQTCQPCRCRAVVEVQSVITCRRKKQSLCCFAVVKQPASIRWKIPKQQRQKREAKDSFWEDTQRACCSSKII